MEIESKFLVLSEAETHDLEKLSQLGNHFLSEAAVQLIEDTFLDTEKIDLMAEGYCLRLRKEAIEWKVLYWEKLLRTAMLHQ